MRIRSSAASIAAFIVTAGLVAGCSTPAAPEPTDAPAVLTPSPEPSPTATPAAAPDLATLCEQLLPLETVQERFGDETVMLTGRPSAAPDISGWSGLLRGMIDCAWGTDEHRNVVVTLRRGDTSVFPTIYDQTREHAGEDSGWRFDAFGRSIDACSETYSSNCQFSLLAADDIWLELALDADPGTSLLPEAQIRERWDPEIERIIAASGDILDTLPAHAPDSPDCEQLLSDDEATALVGAPIQLLDQGMFFHDMSLLGVGGPTPFDADHCFWSDFNSGSAISVAMTRDPLHLRAEAFDRVSPGPLDGDHGASAEVVGAAAAWRYCVAMDGYPERCALDLLVDDLWLNVHVDVDGALEPVVERIVANLTS